MKWLPILPPIGLAHFHAGDFRDGVPFVRRLQRAAQQVFFLERLRCVFRVNARAAEKQQLLHAALVRAVNEIVLHFEIFVEELRGQIVVRENAAHACRRNEDEFRLLVRVKFPHRLGIHQFQFSMRASHEVCETFPLQLTPDRAADQAAMPGYIDSRVFLHLHARRLFLKAGPTAKPFDLEHADSTDSLHETS